MGKDRVAPECVKPKRFLAFYLKRLLLENRGGDIMSYLEEYCEAVMSGEIVACNKIKLICKKLLYDIDHPGEWHFDEQTALRHIEFIEKFCCIPSGDIGKPFKLELFQKAWLEAAFGFVDDDGLRKYNEVMIVCGRKNGKSSLLAAILLDMLINDGEGSPQCVTAATMREQAALSFNAALKMVRQSPMLSKHVKKRVSDLYFAPNMGTIRALSNNTNSLDGLDLSMVCADEMSAWKNRDTYDLLKQAMGARKQPLFFCITTNGFVRDGIFDAQYEYAKNILEDKADNKRFLPFIYELDDANEWDKEDCYIKANPGLGTVKSMDYLRQMVQKAKDDPSFKPTVLVKDFNVPQTSESAWLRYEDLNNEEMIDQTFDYCIGGFDAADTTDLNAAVAIMMRPDDPKVYVKSMFWIPESVIQQMDASGNRRERDNVPYRLWIDQGYMRTCPGSKCEKRIFLEWFKELRDDYDLYTTFIGFDPWHVDDSLISEFKNEFGQNAMIPVRQGTATLSEPMKNLAADFTEHNVVYDNNPVLKWCLINTEVKTDVNGNIQPCKGRDRRNRIDGLAALLDAYVVLKNNFDKYINLNG